MDTLNGRLDISGWGWTHSQLVPHPLPGCGEVEVLSSDRKAIHKRDATPCREAFVGKSSSFQQSRGEQMYLGDLAAHAVDFNPVACVDSVFPDQDKPPQKGNDEILQRDSQGRGSQAKDRRRLLRHAKHN